MNLRKKPLQKYLSITIPVVVFVGIVWKVVHKLSSDRMLQLDSYLENHPEINYTLLPFIIVCAVLNWSLESLKWKFLVQPIEEISFVKSLGAVLAGVSLGFFTPANVGDYFGRTMLLDSKDRFYALGGLLVSRVAQTLVTVFMGCWGIYYLQRQVDLSKEFDALLYGSLFVFLLILVLFFYRKAIISRFLTFSLLKKIAQFFAVIKKYKLLIYKKVLLVSVLRYMSFLLQFILVGYMMNTPFELFSFLAVVSVVMLMKTVIVSFNFFSELGLRELGAALLFPLIGLPVYEGVVISLVVWVFNILLPALWGALMVLKLKIW